MHIAHVYAVDRYTISSSSIQFSFSSPSSLTLRRVAGQRKLFRVDYFAFFFLRRKTFAFSDTLRGHQPIWRTGHERRLHMSSLYHLLSSRFSRSTPVATSSAHVPYTQTILPRIVACKKAEAGGCTFFLKHFLSPRILKRCSFRRCPNAP